MMQEAAFIGVLAIFSVKEQKQFQLEFILERFWNCSSQMGLCKENAIEWHRIFCWGFFGCFLFVCFHLFFVFFFIESQNGLGWKLPIQFHSLRNEQYSKFWHHCNIFR